MGIKCNNTDALIQFVNTVHPTAKVTHPTAEQTQVSFDDGLKMNVYTTGTVNFQGKSFENHTSSDLVNVIEAINRPKPEPAGN
jgi:hypothetical protein